LAFHTHRCQSPSTLATQTLNFLIAEITWHSVVRLGASSISLRHDLCLGIMVWIIFQQIPLSLT